MLNPATLTKQQLIDALDQIQHNRPLDAELERQVRVIIIDELEKRDPHLMDVAWEIREIERAKYGIVYESMAHFVLKAHAQLGN